VVFTVPSPSPVVRSQSSDRTILWLHGEHDLATTGFLTDTLGAAIAGDQGDIVVDMSHVTFIDAATVGVLLRGRALLADRSRRLTFRSPPTCAQRVLGACGLSGLVEAS
jgi:anti-sigma B factor antagonist